MSSNLNNPEEIFRNLAAQFGLKVTSGRRTPEQNRAVGGAKGSHHLNGTALDVSGDPAKMREFTATVQKNYGDKLTELFHDPVGAWKRGRQVKPIGGHSDHVHVAWGGGSNPQSAIRNPQRTSEIPNTSQPSILDSLLNQQEPPMYRQIIDEVMGSTGADEQTARAYLDHPEGKKRFPMAQEMAQADQILRDSPAFLPAQKQKQLFSDENPAAPLPAVAAPAKVAPQAKPARTAPAQVPRSTNGVDNRVKILQSRVSALDEQLKQDTATRTRLMQNNFPTEQFDKVMFGKNRERAALLEEINTVKSKGAPKVTDLSAKLAELEAARNTAQRAGAQAGSEQERQRLYSQASQSNTKIQSLKKIIETEAAGGTTHPLEREAVNRPNREIHQPTISEQISGGVGAGAAGAFAGVDNLIANIMNAVVPTSGDTYKLPGQGVIDPSSPQTARERAEDYQRLQQISAEGAGPGLTPALASAAAQAGLTYPLFRGAGMLGSGIAGTVGAPALLGEAASLGTYGALEHAHEGNPEIAKATALNALLPLAGGALKNFSAPTRMAGEFAAGFAPTVAMGGSLEEGLAQGLTGAGMAAAGGGRAKDEPNVIAEINRKIAENPDAKFEDFAPHEQEALFNHYEKGLADSIGAKLEQGNADLTPHEQAFIQKYGGNHDSAQPVPENNQQQTGVKAQAKTDEEIAQAVDAKINSNQSHDFTPEELDFISRHQPEQQPAEATPTVRPPQAPLDVDIRAAEAPAPEPEAPPAPREKDGPTIKPKEQTLEQALKFNERVLGSMDKAFPEKTPSVTPIPSKEPVTAAPKIEAKPPETKPAEALPESRDFIVNDKPVTVTDPESIAAYDTAKARHDQQRERARNMSDKQSAGKASKAAGMQFAADKRKIANMLTVKEAARANQEKRAADRAKITAPEVIPEGAWRDPKLGIVRPHDNQTLIGKSEVRVIDSKNIPHVIKRPAGMEVKANDSNTKASSGTVESPTPAAPRLERPEAVKPEARNPVTKPAKAAQNQPDIIQAIRELGGIKSGDRQGEQDRLRESRLKQPGVFSKDGQSYDQMAQRLHDEGYLDAPDTAEMFAKLDRAASGERLTARTEEAQNAAADADAETFANRPIEENQNDFIKPNTKSGEVERDILPSRNESSMVSQGSKPIEATAPAESARLAEARTRFEDQQAKLTELNRRKQKGENVTLDIEEQARVTQRARNQVRLLEAAEQKGKDLEGAKNAADEVFQKGETPKVSDLMTEYKISYDEAYSIVGEGAKRRIQEKFRDNSAEKTNPNEAASLKDQVNPKVSKKIFYEATKRGIDPVDYSKELYGTDYATLTKAKAAEMIDKITSLSDREAYEIKVRQHEAAKARHREMKGEKPKIEKGLYGETLTPEQQARIEARQATEGGFLGSKGPKLINLARGQSDKGQAGFNKFKLLAAKHGFTDKAAINQAWNDAQNMPPLPSAGDIAKDLLNTPKTLEATGEVSMLLRQGGILSVQHPILAGKALVRAVKALKPSSLDAFKTEIDTHPRAKQMEDAGLYLSNRETGNTSVNAREEAFMSKLIGKIPVFGKLHEATERLNTTFLDKIRMDAFDQYAEAIGATKGSEADFKVAADFINNLSGRGNIHESLQKFEPFLNGTLFSPRFLTSRLRVLNPVSYAKMYKQSPVVAKKAMLDMAKYIGTVGTTLTLAKLAGAEVGLNPDDADFLKIKFGDTRFDIMSGLQQPLRVALRLGLRGVRAANGTEVKEKDQALSILLNFGRTKLSPIAGYLVDADQGKNMVGEKFDFKSNTAKLFLPLYYKDLYDAYQKEGLAGVAKTGGPGFVGIGTQTYKKKGASGSSAGALKF